MAIDLDVHGNTKPLEAAVQAAINRIRRQPIKITVDDKGATQPLGNMKRAADEFSKSMEAANARILAFGASMAIINGVADAFKGMVRNMVEVEKSMADINVVMGLSAQNLDKFGDGLFKVAKETGAAFRVAADAATEYARQGLSMEESLKRTRDALILTRLTGMDSAEAVKSLTAAMNTYGNQIKDTTQLVSKFAAVDVQFAVSAEDFAAAISRTGQAAKSAGVDIDELIGIVTSAQQQTARGGAVIGNALKTIFTKTGRTDTLNQLEDLGIAVRDLEGNTIGAKRILTELANTFDHLSEAQKAQITQTMGGLFHINILKAVLSDAAKQNGILARATEISSSATDEAIQKNQQLRETMSAMATETGLAIKQVSTQIGEIALAPGMEKILNTVKSLAEGLSGVLGDGEGIGNKFATGFLKGVGNIITGPGLVVLTTVFVKLFMTAAKFTKESLSSLIGVTTEAQKQKAIQTSLVALIGQNAALGKELLRTDITRTEKEKILLGLLQAQTAEANKLNAISKQLASTLYTRGYGPGLTQGKRRAYGHIPNFADPERAQAAKGGYAAGSIRTMNIPGEGSVIYNSAETVKNFAGFKQPAIMPPQSSKAGKNYQQAFGSIHGFDPYAAGGYIPNFARLGMSNAKFAAKINRGEMTVDEAVARGYTGGLAGTTVSKTSDLKNQRFKHLNKGGSQYVVLVASEGPDSVAGHYFVGNKKMSPNRAYQYPSAFKNKKGVNPARVDVPFYSLDARDQDLNSGKNSPYRNAIYNGLKESGSNLISKILTDLGFSSKAGKRNILTDRDVSAMGGNVFEGVIASVLNDANFKNYQSRGETARIDLPKDDDLYRLFGVKGGSLGAEAKITSGKNNIKDAAVKFYDMLAFGGGFVPNFANPLSDAIGREKAAGVPVSQIRVGSHSALMSKGNPLGLGVTNTYDEPNGLRDVFGANGFVPNYAVGDMLLGKPNASENLDYLNKEIKGLKDNIKQYKLKVKNLDRNSAELGMAQKDLRNAQSNLSAATKLRREEIKKVGRTGGGMGSMALMMGLPMISGFIGNNDPTSRIGGVAQGGLMGAATGASLGMILPGLGTAIGAAVGGIYGMISGFNDAKKAALEKASADRAAAKASARAADMNLAASLSQAFQGKTARSNIGNLNESLNTGTLAARTLSIGTSELKDFHAETTYLDAFKNIQAIEEKEIQRINESIEGIRSRVALDATTLDSKSTAAFAPEDLERQRENFQKAIKSMEGQKTGIASSAKTEIITSMFSGKKNEFFAAPEFEKIFGNVEVSGEKILETVSSFEKTDEGVKKLDALFDTLYEELKKQTVNQNKINKAIILRLNKEKNLLSAQEAFNKQMNSSAETYASANNKLDFILATQESTMGEMERAGMIYAKALMNAAETYKTSTSKAQQDISVELYNKLTSQEYEGEFIKYMTNVQKKDPGQFLQMSREEQKGIAERVSLELPQGVDTASSPKYQMEQFLENQQKSYEIIEQKAKSTLKIEEGRAKSAREISDALYLQKTGPDAFGKGIEKGMFDLRKNIEKMDYQLGQQIPQNLANGLATAMSEGLSGAKDIGDALRDAAVNFLNMISQAMMQKAASNIVSMLPFSRGGNARSYSRGGGVPARVSDGEYLMSREAVAKYGGSFMHGLNAGGKIPGYSNGGFAAGVAPTSTQYKSGKAYQSMPMSGFFYSQSGNVGLQQDSESLRDALAEKRRAEQERRQEILQRVAEMNRKEEERVARKEAKRKAIFGAIKGAVLSFGIGQIAGMAGGLLGKFGSSAAGKLGSVGATKMFSGGSNSLMMSMPDSKFNFNAVSELGGSSAFQQFGSSYGDNSFFNSSVPTYNFRSRGGKIGGYANGGYISGKSGIDQIPAMLSEGEYVIRASSARQLGRPLLDRINAGKFNDGGAVDNVMQNSETSGSGAGNTNNINISVNIEGGSVQSQNTNVSASAGNSTTENQSKESYSVMAEKIKEQVLGVIMEEQRPGGLLA